MHGISVHGPHKRHIYWSLLQRHTQGDDDQDTSKYPSAAQPSDTSSYNECDTAGSDTADQAPQFEEAQCYEEGQADIEMSEYAAVDWLEGT